MADDEPGSIRLIAESFAYFVMGILFGASVMLLCNFCGNMCPFLRPVEIPPRQPNHEPIIMTRMPPSSEDEPSSAGGRLPEPALETEDNKLTNSTSITSNDQTTPCNTPTLRMLDLIPPVDRDSSSFSLYNNMASNDSSSAAPGHFSWDFSDHNEFCELPPPQNDVCFLLSNNLTASTEIQTLPNEPSQHPLPLPVLPAPSTSSIPDLNPSHTYYFPNPNSLTYHRECNQDVSEAQHSNPTIVITNGDLSSTNSESESVYDLPLSTVYEEDEDDFKFKGTKN